MTSLPSVQCADVNGDAANVVTHYFTFSSVETSANINP